jgi:hypothetical protein
VPPHQAAQFTVSELAALRIVADQMKRHGTCALCLDAIAAMAGTCRTIVRYALRKANALRLVIVFERRRALLGRRRCSLPDLLTCRELACDRRSCGAVAREPARPAPLTRPLSGYGRMTAKPKTVCTIAQRAPVPHFVAAMADADTASCRPIVIARPSRSARRSAINRF